MQADNNTDDHEFVIFQCRYPFYNCIIKVEIIVHDGVDKCCIWQRFTNVLFAYEEKISEVYMKISYFHPKFDLINADISDVIVNII